MATTKRKSVTLKLEKRYTIFLDNGQTISVPATSSADAVKKAKKE